MKVYVATTHYHYDATEIEAVTTSRDEAIATFDCDPERFIEGEYGSPLENQTGSWYYTPRVSSASYIVTEFELDSNPTP